MLEVNISPSLATESPLDLAIKANLMTDLFNLVSVKRMDRRRDNINKMKQRIKNYSRPKPLQSRGVSNSKNQNTSKIEPLLKSDAQDYLDK